MLVLTQQLVERIGRSGVCIEEHQHAETCKRAGECRLNWTPNCCFSWVWSRTCKWLWWSQTADSAGPGARQEVWRHRGLHTCSTCKSKAGSENWQTTYTCYDRNPNKYKKTPSFFSPPKEKNKRKANISCCLFNYVVRAVKRVSMLSLSYSNCLYIECIDPGRGSSSFLHTISTGKQRARRQPCN